MTIASPETARVQAEAAWSPLTRRRVLFGTAGLLCAAGAATAVYAGAIEPRGLVVTSYALNPPRWPAGRKLSITVIADLHAGEPDMPLEHVTRIVDTANALRSDLTVLLGDFIAWYHFRGFKARPMPQAQWSAELARLTAPLGVWTILGNHDWWHDLPGIRRALASAHIPVLENDAVLLGQEGQKFWLAGLGDQLAIPLGHGKFLGADDLPLTLSRLRTEDPVLMLVHEPDIFPRIPERVSLTLAGHTHGGQIRLPLIWPAFVPSKFGARFAYGHIVERNRHMIVSGGLGTSFVPARLGVPPEILHITLGA